MKRTLILILVFGICSNLFPQRNIVELKVYNSEKNYSILYPDNWNAKKDNDGILSFESKKIKGGIYISEHYGITFPNEHMNKFILESNKLPDQFEQNILNVEENEVKSWYVSYTDSNSNLICMSAYKRKGDYLLFVSTEIEPKLWKNGWKENLTKVIQSIKLKI